MGMRNSWEGSLRLGWGWDGPEALQTAQAARKPCLLSHNKKLACRSSETRNNGLSPRSSVAGALSAIPNRLCPPAGSQNRLAFSRKITWICAGSCWEWGR